MEKEGKGKSLIIVITLLIIIILGLVGYICYDKGVILSKNKIESNEKNNANKKVNDDCIKETTDINENQNLKFKYFASKEENFYRYSITLAEADSDSGYFTLSILNKLEGPSASGIYRIENGKLILSSNDEDDVQIFRYVGGTVVEDPNQQIAPGYKTIIIDYNEDELSIGNYKFYKVN